MSWREHILIAHRLICFLRSLDELLTPLLGRVFIVKALESFRGFILFALSG
jgi:hypothetical protein